MKKMPNTIEDDATALILNQSSGFLYGEPSEDPIDMKDAEAKTLSSMQYWDNRRTRRCTTKSS